MTGFHRRLLIRDPTHQAEMVIFVFLFISRFTFIRIDVRLIKSPNISDSASRVPLAPFSFLCAESLQICNLGEEKAPVAI